MLISNLQTEVTIKKYQVIIDLFCPVLAVFEVSTISQMLSSICLHPDSGIIHNLAPSLGWSCGHSFTGRWKLQVTWLQRECMTDMYALYR